MTAYVDTVIFLVVIMMAIAATAQLNTGGPSPGPDPEEMIEIICNTEVRISDLTNEDDDTLVYLPDLMAYSTKGRSEVTEYLCGILDRVYGPGMYLLTYEYEGISTDLGTGSGFGVTSYSETVSTSVGGKISMTLTLYK